MKWQLYKQHIHENTQSLSWINKLIAYTFKYTISKYFSSQDSNEGNQELAEETDEYQWKTISLSEYKNSMQLEQQMQKLESTIDEMTQVIRSKDSQLENLRTVLQREKHKFIDVSNLSTVSFFKMFTFYKNSMLFVFVYFLYFSGTKRSCLVFSEWKYGQNISRKRQKI